MKTLTTILTAIALGAIATAADEQPATPPAPGAPPAPADGEAKKKRNPEEAFAKLDSNSDKVISLDEFKAGRMAKRDPAKADEIFKKKDKDNDGKLTFEEFTAHPPRGEKKPK